MRADAREPFRPLAPLPKLPFVVLFGAFAIIAFAVAFDRGSPPPPPIDSNLPQPTPGQGVRLPLSLEDGLPLARVRAQHWRQDARLILVSAQLDWADGTPAALGLPRAGSLTYTFAGLASDFLGRDRYPVLTVMIGRESARIFYEGEKTISVEPGATVELTDLAIDSSSAFVLAQRLTGEDYRAECSASRRQVSVVLDTSTPERPRWAVVYYDQRDPTHNDIVVRVDAQSGTPTVETDLLLPCATG